MKMRMFLPALIFVGLASSCWAAGPIRIDKNNMHVELVKKVKPVYPPEARKERISGAVVMDATVDEQGKVIEVKVTKSANPLLDTAAVDAVKQWEYTPLKIKGKPVSYITSITVNFAFAEKMVKPEAAK